MRNNDFIKFSAHHLNIFLMNFYVFFSLCYNEYICIKHRYYRLLIVVPNKPVHISICTLHCKRYVESERGGLKKRRLMSKVFAAAHQRITINITILTRVQDNYCAHWCTSEIIIFFQSKCTFECIWPSSAAATVLQKWRKNSRVCGEVSSAVK